jgi:GAF domain-containing protein
MPDSIEPKQEENRMPSEAELFILFDQSRQEPRCGGLAPLFDTVLASVNASAIFLYAADQTGARLQLKLARCTAGAGFIDRLAVAFRDDDARFLRDLRTPLDARPAEEPRVEKLPEVLQYRFERLLLVPLRWGDGLAGLLTAGRRGAQRFDAGEVESLVALGRTLAAGLHNDQLDGHVRQLSRELEEFRAKAAELERKLEERKLVERAKGLLQVQGLTEEAAYLQIRLVSRRRRVTMAETAREIIERNEIVQPAVLSRPTTA